MNVAIFYDAAAVAGDAALLRESQGGADRGGARRARLSRAFRARGRGVRDADRPVQQPDHLEGEGDALDLKKGGIFPIVHGVRALALEHGLIETTRESALRNWPSLALLKPDFARDCRGV